MEHKFVKIGNLYINLALVTGIVDSPDLEVICIYMPGDNGDPYKLHGKVRQAFLAALEKIGYYAA